MSPLRLEVSGLTRRFGALTAADGVDLEVRPGEIHALIGPNGAGKSTVIALIAGELRADAGRIRLAGRDITRLPPAHRARLGMARSFQVTRLFEDLSVFENALLATQARTRHSFRFLRPATSDRGAVAAAAAALAQAGLAGSEDGPAAALGHGQKRQLELAMALAAGTALLLLDEPLAGQSAAESQATVALLDRLRERHGMLLVEHDMDAIFALADRITVLVGGRVLASGPPAAIRADAAVRQAYLGDA